MVKINKKRLLVTMLLLFSAILFVGGLTIGNKPQVNANVKAETSTTLKGFYNNHDDLWYSNLSYNIVNLTITTNYTPQADSYYAQILDVSLEQDGSLKAYVFANGNDADGNILYDCVIYGAVDTIYAPTNCYFLFSGNSNVGSSINETKLSTLKTIKFENFDTSKVTNMSYMFNYCSAMTNLTFSNNFDTSKVTSMSNMFDCCRQLIELDMSCFNTFNCKSMNSMFSQCNALQCLNLSNFNTSNVISMDSMFSGCSSLTSLNLSNFNTSNVTSMQGMFAYCGNLSSLDVSSFNTDKVSHIGAMFKQCRGLTSLDLSNFNTANVKYMFDVFRDLQSLKTLDISGFTFRDSSFLINIRDVLSILPSLHTIKTPKICEQSIPIPNGNWYQIDANFTELSGPYTSLNSANTGMTLKTRVFLTSGWRNKTNQFVSNSNITSIVFTNVMPTTYTNSIEVGSNTNSAYSFNDSVIAYINGTEITFYSPYIIYAQYRSESLFSYLNSLTILDLKNFGILDSTNALTTNIFSGLNNLKKLVAPKILNQNLTLPNSQFVNSKLSGANRVLTNTISAIEDGATFKKAYTATANGNGIKLANNTGNNWIIENDGLTAKSYIAYDETLNSFPQSTSNRYIINGWNSLSDGSGTTYESISNITSNITVYAQYTVVLINIPNFNASKYQSGTSATLSQTWAEGLTYNLNSLVVTNDHTKVPTNYILAYEVSEEGNNSIVAFVVQNGSKYDCVIYGQVETIYAPTSCSGMFSYSFSSCNSLTSIIFEDFNTSNVTNFDGMFLATTWHALALEGGFDLSSETCFRDAYKSLFGADFVGQDEDISNDEQEAKQIISVFVKEQMDIEAVDGLSYLDISTFEISSIASTEMFLSSAPKTLIAPKTCSQDVALFAPMYAENSETQYVALSNNTNGLSLVSEPNTSADNVTGGTETPATGFDMTDLAITTTLGFVIMIAVLVVFNKTKKKYNKV